MRTPWYERRRPLTVVSVLTIIIASTAMATDFERREWLWFSLEAMALIGVVSWFYWGRSKTSVS